jgi:hypothetical protein
MPCSPIVLEGYATSIFRTENSAKGETNKNSSKPWLPTYTALKPEDLTYIPHGQCTGDPKPNIESILVLC